MSELIQMLHDMSEQIRDKVQELGIENLHCSISYSGKYDVRSVTAFKDEEPVNEYKTCSHRFSDGEWYEYADQMNGYERSEKNETVAS